MIASFYVVLSYLTLPFLVLRLFLKSFKQPAYGKRIKERLGIFSAPRISVWIHAVSLGEVIAAAPLIEKLIAEHNRPNIMLTTTTPTGSEKALALFKDRVFHVYAPFDVPCIVRRFLNKIQPKLVIIMETELWPNWFLACKKKNIPIIIANARLSPQSQEGYNRIRSLTAMTLNCVDKLLAQTNEDAKRFIELGISPDKVSILGNIKFDLTIPDNIHEKAQSFRTLWQKDRLVWIAGSTHHREEEVVFNAFKLIKKEYPSALLILVPRHPERFEKMATLSQNVGFNTVLRTSIENTPPEKLVEMDVLLGNTIGEMLLFLASSDVAFIGGSIIPQGGHNILEPAALYVPIITGPHMFNFQKIYDEFLQAESMITINDAEDGASLAQAVSSLFANPLLREEYASLGFKIIERNQGALEKHLNVIRSYNIN